MVAYVTKSLYIYFYSFSYFNVCFSLAVNSGLKGQRVKPISAVDLSVVEADVCTTSVDIAEFHTMVKLGM